METDIKKIEKKINIFVSKWDGNCYSIACEIVKAGVVQGRAVYGHYYGPVAKTGKWDTRRIFQRHGWVVLNDGRIFDPTRWSFEDKPPYIAVFDSNSKRLDDYDEGGNKFREAMETLPPEFDEQHKLVELRLEIKAEEFVNRHLGYPPYITIKMVFWLANLSVDRLAPHREEVYRAICDAGHKAFIPIDNFNSMEAAEGQQ